LIICGNIEVNPGFNPTHAYSGADITSYMKSKGTKILHMNARSLGSKLDEIKVLIEELKPDLFCVSETWFNRDISDIEVQINEYFLIRNDRSDGRAGGGVAVYIRQNRNFEFDVLNNSSNFEFITLKLKYKNKRAFYVSSVYRPPDSNLSTNGWNELLERLLCPSGSEHIILGDLNIDLLKPDSKVWVNNVKSTGYDQIIEKETRITDTTASLIDHIYVSLIDNISNSGTIDIPISDHQFIFVSRKLNFRLKYNNKKREFLEVRLWKNFNFDKLLEILNKVDFSQLYSTKLFNSDDFCEKLTEKLCNVFNTIIPLKKFKPKIRSSTPYINNEIKSLIRERNFYYKKYKKSLEAGLPYDDFHNIYIFYRNKVSNSIKYHKRYYFKKLIEDNRNNTKSLWRILTSVMKLNFSFNIEKPENEIDVEKINEYFVTEPQKVVDESLSSFSDSEDGEECLNNTSLVNNRFDFPEMSENDLQEVLHEIHNKNSCGNDIITNKMLKIITPLIVPHILALINLIIKTSKFPDCWKTSKVFPLFKGSGDRSDFNNFRPISQLPSMSKLFEKHIFKTLSDFLDRNSYLSCNQFGFRRNRSTIDALLQIQKTICNARHKKLYVCVIAIDFKKAFDILCRKILFKKLFLYGLSLKSIDLIISYFSERQQFVSFYGKNSKSLRINTGVIQGSIIGPLLFSIYIDDMMKIELNCKIILYADDTTLIFMHKDLVELEKIINLNMILLSRWLLKNNLVINYDKSHFLLIGSKNSNNFNVNINNKSIRRTLELKILGLTFDEFLKFDKHIETRVQKTSKFIRVFAKLRHFMPFFSLSLMFKALLLPQMTYACEVWGFTYDKYLMKLEVLQNIMARVITFSVHRETAYPLFKKLKWIKLKDIITINSSKFIFKAVNGMSCEPSNNLFSLLPKRRTRSDADYQLKIENWKLQYLRNSLFYKGVETWNELPVSLRLLNNFKVFKKNLRNLFI
jgi:hypothetical protein